MKRDTIVTLIAVTANLSLVLAWFVGVIGEIDEPDPFYLVLLLFFVNVLFFLAQITMLSAFPCSFRRYPDPAHFRLFHGHDVQ